MSETVDYQKICTAETSIEDRRKRNIGDIFSNSIQCKKCGDIIRSRNRHDFRWCSCKSVAIDGGSWYQRIVGDEYNNLVIYFDDVEDK